MKIQVWNHDGKLLYEFDDRTLCGFTPGIHYRERVVKALIDAGVQLAFGRLPPVDMKL